MNMEPNECSCSVCIEARANYEAEIGRTPFRESQARVNAQQWAGLADALESQERRQPDPFDSDPFRRVEVFERWWFPFLVALAILITVCSLYVLSCGANPFGGCTL